MKIVCFCKKSVLLQTKSGKDYLMNKKLLFCYLFIAGVVLIYLSKAYDKGTETNSFLCTLGTINICSLTCFYLRNKASKR